MSAQCVEERLALAQQNVTSLEAGGGAESPTDYSECSQDHSECPQEYSECPQDYSECPKEYSECSQDYNECPQEYSECPKDSGYSWVVLAATFAIQVAGVGLSLSTVVFTPTLIRAFDGNREAVSLVGSLHIGFVFLAGPVAGMLTERFGYRVTIMSGAILAAAGVATAACSTQLWTLHLTFGVMGGTGVCMTYIPSTTLLARYFDKWKRVAFSVNSTGIGIGVLIFPVFIQWLIEKYGWRGANLLIAGILLQLAIFGALLRDPEPHNHVSRKLQRLSFKKQLAIFRNWRFDLYLLNSYLFGFGSLIMLLFISDYAERQGMTSYQGVYLVSILGLSNAVGRASNIAISLCKCNHTFIYIISCILSGVSICFVNLHTACPHKCFVSAALSCAFYGFLFGVQLANLAIVFDSLVDTRYLNSGFGIAMLMNGLGSVSGPPVAALLYKLGGGNYELPYYIAGSTTILAGLVLVPALYTKHSDTLEQRDKLPGAIQLKTVDTFIDSAPETILDPAPGDKLIE